MHGLAEGFIEAPQNNQYLGLKCFEILLCLAPQRTRLIDRMNHGPGQGQEDDLLPLQFQFLKIAYQSATGVRLNGHQDHFVMVNGAQAMHNRGTIQVSLRETNQACELTFRDSGPGIPPDILEKIFTPFFTTRREQGGTGLGLSISNQLAELMGGRMFPASIDGLERCMRSLAR